VRPSQKGAWKRGDYGFGTASTANLLRFIKNFTALVKIHQFELYSVYRHT